jgi:radical SAM protein with 4Fe4S-binding SPASM domain
VVRIYQDSQVFRKLRDANHLEGKCGRCEFRHVCGGSRVRAYAETDNPFAEDPACAYVPAGGAAA